jgi:protein N-terminal methyltransferase
MVDRSDRAWKSIFDQAGLKLVREQVQDGLPEGLYVVKMCVSLTYLLISINRLYCRYALR